MTSVNNISDLIELEIQDRLEPNLDDLVDNNQIRQVLNHPIFLTTFTAIINPIVEQLTSELERMRYD